MEEKTEIMTPKLLPIKRWENHFSYPSLGTLRYLALRRKENGFDACLSKINGRLYINPEKFFIWAQEQK